MKNKRFWVSLLAGLMAAIMIVSLIVGLIPRKVSAASSSEIKNQIEELEKQNEEMEAQLEELRQQRADNLSEIEVAVAQKELIEEEMKLLQEQIDNLNEQIAAYNVLIADKQEELEEAEAQLAVLNEEYKERLRVMEEQGELSYWTILLSARSFTDLLDRVQMVEEIKDADARRLREMNDLAEEIEAAKAVLVSEREQMQAVKDQVDETRLLLEERELEVEELMNDLASRGLEYEELMADKEEQLGELEKEIGAKEEEFNEASVSEYLATATTAPTVPTYVGGSSSNAGVGIAGTPVVDDNGITWLVPCDYRKISSAFGWRIHPVYHDQRFHNGVDLDCDCLMINKDTNTTDSPILATRDGVVTIATYSSSAGWYVKIDHMDGYVSVYMHMCDEPFVSVGQTVVAGQVIGCIGTTGTSTGDHLHFGIYLNGSSVNPMEYIG